MLSFAPRAIAALAIVWAAGTPAGATGPARHGHPHHAPHPSGHHARALPPRQVGRAMYYGETFQGRTMADGDGFDAGALTAASRTLPLGLRARVTNLRNRRSAVVTITDRGRLRARHVILDLSRGAARAIGLTERQGIAPVSVQPLRFVPAHPHISPPVEVPHGRRRRT